jgi:hypothetical protein
MRFGINKRAVETGSKEGGESQNNFKCRRAQVSVFVIVAIVILAGIVLYFIFRDAGDGLVGISAELSPVYDYFLGCVELETKLAIQLVGTQGGRIDSGEYVPGSEYAPFSSHLNFLGFPVKYWYYVSGNGVITEQVPQKNEMESELERFIAEGVSNCDFDEFYRRGFEVELGEPSVRIDVLDNKVDVEVNAEMTVSKEEDSARKSLHVVSVDSKLGKFYGLAREIYDKEVEDAFLEEYGVDVLNLYAPVDGVEIQCAPEVWTAENVMRDIRRGLEANIGALKLDGDYYTLNNEDGDYFVVDKGVDEAVNFIYSKDWPTKIEVVGEGVDGEIMLAESVGAQAGLGVMGFCYVPYHFVYDVSFPVMVQVFDTEELFQFPVAVIIDNNLPRQGIVSGVAFGEEEDFDLCGKPTKDIEVDVFDINLNRVDFNVSYECFDQRCRLGESVNGKWDGRVPACVNGFLNLMAEGYADERILFSSNRERFADVVMEREHIVKVTLEVAGEELEGTAIVSFVKENGDSRTVAMPHQKMVELSEGSYEVKIYVYGNSSVVIPSSTKTECVDVPKSGLLGFFGSTKEKCFDITTPETKIGNALIGGGVVNTYLLESELEKGDLVLSVDSLPKPRTIEELANNFELFETRGVEIEFL